MSANEKDTREIRAAVVEQAKTQKENVGNVETRLLQRIAEEKARNDQERAQVGYEIRDLKQITRDGFRDLDQKLDRKQDKPGR